MPILTNRVPGLPLSAGLVPERGAGDPGETSVLDSLPVGVVVVTEPGRLSWANPAYFRSTGRDPDVLGRDFHELVETEGTWSAVIREAVDAALRDGRPARFEAVRARHRDRPGGVFLDLEVRPLPDAPGAPRRAMVVVQDVTGRVEEHERAALFYASFQSSTNAMQLTDAEGIMIDVNPAYERIYGYARAECIGRRPNLVRSRYTPPEVYREMWNDLLDPDRGYWAGEILNRDRSGHERPVLLTITGVRARGAAISHYLGVAVDQSERRDWEVRAAHSDKLASIGQLAAGVAHEINTPLANVMLVAESLRRRTEDPFLRSRLDTLTEQVDIAARIVRSLLDFARREEPRLAEVDLRDVAREAVRFLRDKQSGDAEVVEEYAEDPVEVLGDRPQLLQVVTNILNNAYDATEGGGRIRVAVRRNGERAELEVIDAGPGIPPEILSHIFEPFFTTKPEGKGTGLGLAVCHGIVGAHHGSILARNAAEGGAEFLVSLPLRSPPGR